jgi:benzoyl-CoA reductase/2-hydroxyglutaryl-CoA dehydratase subunit BcrC/BadD/HgdB
MSTKASGNGQSSANPLQFLTSTRLLRSRRALRLARGVLKRQTAYRPHELVSLDFTLGLVEGLYADRSAPAIWTNIFFPSELMWGLGLVPFYPEMGASVGAGLGLSPIGVQRSEALGYPVDLCTFNRSAAGLRDAGYYPDADAYVSTSNLCDVTGQMLANFAYEDQRPFFLLDVPPHPDQGAVAYLTAQLEDLVEHWTQALDIRYDRERLRQAIRLSNQARKLALEVMALREAQPAPLRGSAMLGQLGILTSIFGHPAGGDYYQALRDYTLERIERTDPEQTNQKVRLYWMHLKPYFMTELLSHLEDNLGAVIAFEESSNVWWDKLDEEDPIPSLARKILTNPLNGPVERRLHLAQDHMFRYQCAGAIHFSHWGCRQSSGALRNVRVHLRKEGLPLLVIDGDCVDPANLQLGPLRTRIEAFVEMLV